MNVYFSLNLSYLRKSKDLNQSQIADILNVKHGAISAWENGRSYPQFLTLIEICNYFSISLDQLVFKDLEKEGISPPNQFNDDSSFEPNKSLKTSYERKLEQMIIKHCPDLADRLDLS